MGKSGTLAVLLVDNVQKDRTLLQRDQYAGRDGARIPAGADAGIYVAALHSGGKDLRPLQVRMQRLIAAVHGLFAKRGMEIAPESTLVSIRRSLQARRNGQLPRLLHKVPGLPYQRAARQKQNQHKCAYQRSGSPHGISPYPKSLSYFQGFPPKSARLCTKPGGSDSLPAICAGCTSLTDPGRNRSTGRDS